jgi:HEAT repeat protein
MIAMVALVGCFNSSSNSAPVSSQSTNLQAAMEKVPEKPGEADIPKLLALLNDPDPPTRHQAALALGRMDGLVEARLLECLQDESSFVREGAAKAIGRLNSKPKEAVEPLSKLLCDPDRYVRREAGDALIKLGVGGSDQIMAATETLMSVGARERRWAAERLGNERSRAKLAVPSLTRLLDDPEEEVREAAKEALKKIVPHGADANGTGN